ncbi:hypothetical protein AB7M31_003357 [Pseudomonas sp. IAP-CY TE4608]
MMSIGKYCKRDVVTAPPGISIYAATRHYPTHSGRR